MADTTTLAPARFFADVPDLATVAFPASADATADDNAPPRSRVQIAKTGTFRYRGKKLPITQATFDSMVANFAQSIPNDRLACDYDHTPDVPTLGAASTKACGWIVGLATQGGKLYADVEWTWQGAFSIRDGEYRYVSMAFAHAYVRDDGSNAGPTLIGLALTNRPFLEGMAPLSLSSTFSAADFTLAEELPDEPEADDDGRRIVGREMTDFAKFAKVLGLAEDASEDTILAKATDIVTASSISLDERAKAEGKVLLSNDELATLKAAESDKTQLATRLETIEAERADEKFEALFSAALDNRDGAKVAPAEKDELRKFFDAAPEAFAKSLELRSPLVNGTATGARGEDTPEEAPRGVDPEAYALDQQVKAFMAEHTDIDYVTALDRVRAAQKDA